MPTYKEQLAKVVHERLGEKLGFQIGSAIPPNLLEGLGDIPVALQEAIGIGAATMIRAPKRFSQLWARMTGGDPERIHSHLNEGLAEGVRTLVETVAERRKSEKNPDAQPTDKDYADAADAALKEMWKNPQEVDIPEKQQVVVDVQQHVFHDLSCPIVWKGTTTSGKKGEPRNEKPTYQPGFRPVELSWALRNGYTPTTGTCCGQSTAHLIDQIRRAATTIASVLPQLPRRLKKRYYDFLDEATADENKTIQAAGAIPMWTVALLSDALDYSENITSFLKKLPPKPASKLAPLEELAKHVMAALNAASPQLRMVRERVQRLTAAVSNGVVAQRRRIKDKKALFER